MSSMMVNPRAICADRTLVREAERAECLSRTGAAQPDTLQGPLRHKPWWIDFPYNGIYLVGGPNGPQVISTPPLGTSSTVILSYTVPRGHDAVIRKINHNYTGPSFVQGSGDLAWSIRLDGNTYLKSMTNVTVEFGSPQQPLDTFILLKENQLLEYLVSVAPGASIPIAGTFVTASIHGWEKPRRL